MDPSLLPFFRPQGVVVIGASLSPEKLGYGVARNLVQSGYRGGIHFVGQKKGELFGLPLYTELSQVPEPVELAILIVPAHAAARAIEDCGKSGISAAIVMSSGFREVGVEGAVLEQQCVDMARRYGLRLLGPNCIGTIDTHLPLDTSFLKPPMPAKGNIGFISQSGAFCAAIIDWSRGEGFGFSQIVSLGNQADINETDVLAALAEDERTDVIVLYMESVSDGRRFVEIAREVTQRKPVIALKVGRFESGQRAAASHTGALAASDMAFDAAFERAGILRANDTEQMFAWARALEVYPHGLSTSQAARHFPSIDWAQQSPGGRHGIAILTNAGGPGVIAADALEKNGLQLAELDETTLEALLAQLSPAANIHNPVDMLASASPDTYAACLKILLEASSVDSVLVILPPPPMYKAEDVAEKIMKVIATPKAGLSKTGKPVVMTIMGSTLVQEGRSILQRAGVPTFTFPESAASALSALSNRASLLKANTLPQESRRDIPHVPDLPKTLSPEQLISAYGIPTAATKLACSMDEALAAADKLGYPVVMKIASPDILHKSDVGGVVVNLKDALSLHAAYAQMMEEVKAARPQAQIDGVHIQRQIPEGQEVIVGAVRDPQFGPLMMFGSGGVEVEGLNDVAFALAPLNQTEALKMVQCTWAGKKLKGFRNLPRVHEDSVVNLLVKLSHLIIENEFIEEIEINPLRVCKEGAIAIDVRVKKVL